MVRLAFESNYIAPLGPMVDAFEREFCEYAGIEHCVALSSGTAAMHLALRYLGVGPGGEVFASTLTFIGSVSPVTFLGARPVFVDCDMESWNMDPMLLEEALERCERKGALPKAVVPTDLYGQCCDYEGIFGVCERFGVPVVVDAAEAMGSCYEPLRHEGHKEKLEWQGARAKGQVARAKGQGPRDRGQGARGKGQESNVKERWHAGKGARAAVFSFNGNKIMTTSGGGMLASDDGELVEKARFWSQQAREPFAHYQHEEIGYNYRMSNILAAIGRGQLRVLDERVKKKREIFGYYFEALKDVPGIEFMPEPEWSRSNRWLTVVLISPEKFGADREEVRIALEKENIESRPVWKPMHLQPVFNPEGEEDRQAGKFPCRVIGGAISEELFEKGLCLPSGTAMTDSEMDRVVGIVRRAGSMKNS